jgi:hypothetical protein
MNKSVKVIASNQVVGVVNYTLNGNRLSISTEGVTGLGLPTGGGNTICNDKDFMNRLPESVEIAGYYLSNKNKGGVTAINGLPEIAKRGTMPGISSHYKVSFVLPTTGSVYN